MSAFHLNNLTRRCPTLVSCRKEIISAFELLRSAFNSSGKLLVVGNGGSAADADHIVAELMKSFLRRRAIPAQVNETLSSKFGDEGAVLATKLEGALPAISLACMPAITTAFGNDADPNAAFAQLVYGLGNEGDVLLGISTSGNAVNVANALMVAKVKGMKTVGLTGRSGGKFNALCDCVIHAPADETYAIQELHLPIYHALCATLEDEFFNE
ncbi:phosphoheptose isomerase [Clostridia bacterium]|nr:phosphoheptose isomerase [Clostridia bacterium]